MNYNKYLETDQFKADCFEWARECYDFDAEDYEDIVYAMECWQTETFISFINRQYVGGLVEFCKANIAFHNR